MKGMKGLQQFFTLRIKFLIDMENQIKALAGFPAFLVFPSFPTFS